MVELAILSKKNLKAICGICFQIERSLAHLLHDDWLRFQEFFSNQDRIQHIEKAVEIISSEKKSESNSFSWLFKF